MLNRYDITAICTKDGCETITKTYTIYADSYIKAKNRIYQRIHADYHPEGYCINIQ